MLNRFLIVMILLLWAPPLTADGTDALESLRLKVDQGLRIMNDSRLKTPDRRAEKEEKLWRLSRQLIDYQIMSRLVLASCWREFTSAQRDDFVTAFSGFLRRAFLPRLLERYKGEKLYYVQQKRLSPSRAEVAVYVLWNNQKIPFTLNMIKRHGDWKIYDIHALGVSAVKNYRAQFRWLLMTETPGQLIARLNVDGNPES